MSTRSTFVCGEDFHLYEDLMDSRDGGGVYLTLRNAEFEASPHGVTVKIPPAIWETIRKVPSMDFGLAPKSDEDLRARVEKEVDERIAEYDAAKGEDKGWLSFMGSAVYGGADQLRDEQIEQGMGYFTKEREVQRKVLADAERLSERYKRRQGESE